MRFVWKIVLAVMLAVSLAAGVLGGFGMERALEREKEMRAAAAAEESRLLCYALATAAGTGMPESDAVTRRIMAEVCGELSGEERMLALACDGDVFFGDADRELLSMTEAAGDWVWRYAGHGESYALETGMAFRVGGRLYILAAAYDVSPMYAAFGARIVALRWGAVLAMILVGGVAALVSGGMARTVGQIAAAARRMARGEYAQRVRVRGHDDAADLAESFDAMARALEDRIGELEQVARQREEFVGSFAHELKTPLTAMIGYADMIRSQQMEPEKVFRAANYIFTEGRRLEALSLKLLELTVMRHQDYSFRWVSAAWLLESIGGFLEPVMEQYGMALDVEAEEAGIYVDTDLIKTLLMNLVDNARKASEPGSRIGMRGYRSEGRYRITVVDRGRGIPPEELSRITEAFYMVDKSRARAQNGAGLGLALCRQIAEVHGTQLHFASRVGEGTQVSILLRTAQRQRRGRRGTA